MRSPSSNDIPTTECYAREEDLHRVDFIWGIFEVLRSLDQVNLLLFPVGEVVLTIPRSNAETFHLLGKN